MFSPTFVAAISAVTPHIRLSSTGDPEGWLSD
jgi:hypothetical protein